MIASSTPSGVQITRERTASVSTGSGDSIAGACPAYQSQAHTHGRRHIMRRLPADSRYPRACLPHVPSRNGTGCHARTATVAAKLVPHPSAGSCGMGRVIQPRGGGSRGVPVPGWGLAATVIAVPVVQCPGG